MVLIQMMGNYDFSGNSGLLKPNKIDLFCSPKM